MDLELEEIFQWQTPFCTLLDEIGVIEGEDGIGGMLDQMELSEIHEEGLGLVSAGKGGGDGVASSTNLSSSAFTGSTEEPVSSPLWPCDLEAPVVMKTGSVVPAARGSGAELSGISCGDPVGSPQSSTVPALKGGSGVTAVEVEVQEGGPVTPPAAKPKRTRATKATSRKNAPKAKKQCRGADARAEEPKESQVATQAEHIMRERQRRDDMAAKYLILESLLPPAPKRERAVVVETAISFVKGLQQKRDELLKRRDHLKLVASSQSPRQVQSKKFVPALHDLSPAVTASCKKLLQAGENCGTESPVSSPNTVQEDLIASPTATYIPASMGTAIDHYQSSPSAQHLLHVHVHFSGEEIVIEMVCHQPRQNFHSFLLQAVHSFGLDITRSSINRVPHGFVQCSITCTKAQVPNPSQAPSEVQTSATLIGALRNVLTQC